eukprot:TRINITY_DN4597_c7_g1_i1.p1 TRINITY_DN4597_c7_g1~~TRINITY_DN4597_c7_g1_i1.p1  ORF type:complete len:204 (+),score=72.66 TRINITY_DN4597_c7_g1_i1:67-612(+)
MGFGPPPFGGKGGKGGPGMMKGGKFMGKGSGWVRMFNEEKGFGFISPNPDPWTGQVGPDLFCGVKNLPSVMQCPSCRKMVPIKTKKPHNTPIVPELAVVKGGRVNFGIEMGADGKMLAIDVRGSAENPGIVFAGMGGDEGIPELTGEAEMGTFECDSCKTQFQAKPGTLVNCPGCQAQIQL